MYRLVFFHPANRVVSTSTTYRTARNAYREARKIVNAGGWAIITFATVEIASIGTAGFAREDA